MTLQDIQAKIIESANRLGVDAAFALGVAQTESGFRADAKSPVGAIGVMQLMPATAKGLGVDPNDPMQNIEGGVALLAQLLKQYNGDYTKALWAYNAGPGNVAKGILPTETQNYIPKVLSNTASWSNKLGITGDSDNIAPTSYDVNSDGVIVDTNQSGSTDMIFPLLILAIAGLLVMGR